MAPKSQRTHVPPGIRKCGLTRRPVTPIRSRHTPSAYCQLVPTLCVGTPSRTLRVHGLGTRSGQNGVTTRSDVTRLTANEGHGRLRPFRLFNSYRKRISAICALQLWQSLWMAQPATILPVSTIKSHQTAGLGPIVSAGGDGLFVRCCQPRAGTPAGTMTG